MNISRQPLVVIALGAILLAAICAAAGYWFARLRSEPTSSLAAAAGGERKPLYWYDPMQPNQHFDEPGKSPFMDMQLVPKYADEGGKSEAGDLKIDPAIVQNLGIRFARVEWGSLPQTVDAVGTVGFNQRDVAVIQARSNGFVTRVYARAPGDVITQNAPIVDLLVPEWAGAQTEFLALLKSGDHDLIEAARQRLVLLGMPADLIGRIEAARELRTTVTVRSPLAGMIDTLEAREGMTVAIGATLAKINGLATAWIEAAVPEAQGALAQLGRRVEARLTAYPGQRFMGRVIGVLPQANAETRTVRVRIELDNPGGRLRPGMFAQVRLDNGEPIPVLYVASEAVIRTGTRAIVIVAGEQNRFIPTEVQAGADMDGKTIIVKGLAEGQTVVASGQFLIDSEASLKGVLARLAGGSSEPDTEAPKPGGQP
jgi:membrane fusion protein, copper/silver efflux system